jgi:aminoglycoside phosphotransferase (APT) family kinase protein
MATSPFVARLLKHLEAVGFTAVPRYLGRDEKGRDSLSFIPGEVIERWRYYPDAAIAEAGAWLRAFHDATRTSDLLNGKSVVCHNDPGPNNAVFQNGHVAAFIDFDMASPGEPLEDLGYMAWSWCVSSNQERPPVAVQAAQVRVLLDAYGLDPASRAGIIPAMMERHSRNVRLWNQRKNEAPDASLIPTSAARIEEIIAWSQRERAFVEAHKGVFLEALT